MLPNFQYAVHTCLLPPESIDNANPTLTLTHAPDGWRLVTSRNVTTGIRSSAIGSFFEPEISPASTTAGSCTSRDGWRTSSSSPAETSTPRYSMALHGNSSTRCSRSCSRVLSSRYFIFIATAVAWYSYSVQVRATWQPGHDSFACLSWLCVSLPYVMLARCPFYFLLTCTAPRRIVWQDIEFVIQEVSPLIRPGCIAAFSETELGGGLEVREEG